MKPNKTHYRKVFKSDHLGIADLEDYIEEGRKLVFTIDHVKQEIGVKVAGRKINANIAYFQDQIKPLVINSTNSKVMKSFNAGSPFVEDWANTKVELYIDSNVKMKGEIVGGVRIRPIQPMPTKAKPMFTSLNFEKAHKAKATVETIEKSYNLTEAIKLKYEAYVTEN